MSVPAASLLSETWTDPRHATPGLPRGSPTERDGALIFLIKSSSPRPSALITALISQGPKANRSPCCWLNLHSNSWLRHEKDVGARVTQSANKDLSVSARITTSLTVFMWDYTWRLTWHAAAALCAVSSCNGAWLQLSGKPLKVNLLGWISLMRQSSLAPCDVSQLPLINMATLPIWGWHTTARKSGTV